VVEAGAGGGTTFSLYGPGFSPPFHVASALETGAASVVVSTLAVHTGLGAASVFGVHAGLGAASVLEAASTLGLGLGSGSGFVLCPSS
jgi:hypothetical protein